MVGATCGVWGGADQEVRVGGGRHRDRRRVEAAVPVAPARDRGVAAQRDVDDEVRVEAGGVGPRRDQGVVAREVVARPRHGRADEQVVERHRAVGRADQGRRVCDGRPRVDHELGDLARERGVLGDPDALHHRGDDGQDHDGHHGDDRCARGRGDQGDGERPDRGGERRAGDGRGDGAGHPRKVASPAAATVAPKATPDAMAVAWSANWGLVTFAYVAAAWPHFTNWS